MCGKNTHNQNTYSPTPTQQRHGVSPVRDFEMQLGRMPSAMLPYAALLADTSGDEGVLDSLAEAVTAADHGAESTGLVNDGRCDGSGYDGSMGI